MNSNDVVNEDIAFILESVESEFKALSGHRLLLTGGGGFLYRQRLNGLE